MTIHNIINVLVPNMCGAEKIVCQLHSGLLAKGMDSRLIALVGDPSKCLHNFESLGLNKDYGIKAFAKVYNYIKHNCAEGDLIHAHLFPTMLYVSLAVRILRWKGVAVCTEHSTSNRRRGTLLGRLIDWQVYAGYRKIYCISNGVAGALAKWMPRLSEKLTIVENGADLAFDGFEPRENHKKIIIASVGRLHKLKNYEMALKAMSLLLDVDFEYRIAGAGDDEARLKELCEELHLGDKVKFIGYVQDVPSFLKQADIFLITSLWEGFGLAAVEAMNAGLPVIASDVPGLKEIVSSVDPCGVLVSPKEPDEIAAAIMELTDWDKRMRFGQNAFERSLGFSTERMVDGYVGEYERL